MAFFFLFLNDITKIRKVQWLERTVSEKRENTGKGRGGEGDQITVQKKIEQNVIHWWICCITFSFTVWLFGLWNQVYFNNVEHYGDIFFSTTRLRKKEEFLSLCMFFSIFLRGHLKGCSFSIFFWKGAPILMTFFHCTRHSHRHPIVAYVKDSTCS